VIFDLVLFDDKQENKEIFKKFVYKSL